MQKLFYSQQKQELQQLATKEDILMELRPHKGEITLSGLKNRMMDVHRRVLEKLTAFDKKQHTLVTAKNIASYVQWYYDDGHRKNKFSPEVNYEIETAHKSKQTTVQIQDNSGNTYVIDFNKMEEHLKGKPHQKYKLERRPVGGGE